MRHISIYTAAVTDADIYVRPLYPGGWVAHHRGSDVAPTEAESLVAALEAAP